LKILGVRQRRLQMFCRHRECIRRVPRENIYGECCGSPVLMDACYWSSNHCIPSQKFMSISAKVNHNHSPLVLNSDKQGWCCHHSFS